MEEILANVNWIAVLVGAVLAYVVGAFWYSPKMFGEKWMEGVGIKPDDKNSGKSAMVVQGVGTFLLAWVIGVMYTTGLVLAASLIGLAVAVLIYANGMFARKSSYATMVESGYVVLMVVVMLATHAVL